jgi:polysaccharide deacetylase family protein (PEP-CTERM system associated)
VKEARRRGHEIASHGYAHQLVYRLTPKEFLSDVIHARRILEDIVGDEIAGYRAPGFSVTGDTPWFFDLVAEAGHSYTSSVFPARRQHGGLVGFPNGPCVIKTNGQRLVEIPISVSNVLGLPMCFFGGGYLRLFPYKIIKLMGRRVVAEGRPLVFYIHPREIDPTHPRISMPLLRRIKSYVGLNTTSAKLRRVLSDFEFTTFRQYADSLRKESQ